MASRAKSATRLGLSDGMSEVQDASCAVQLNAEHGQYICIHIYSMCSHNYMCLFILTFDLLQELCDILGVPQQKDELKCDALIVGYGQAMCVEICEESRVECLDTALSITPNVVFELGIADVEVCPGLDNCGKAVMSCGQEGWEDLRT